MFHMWISEYADKKTADNEVRLYIVYVGNFTWYKSYELILLFNDFSVINLTAKKWIMLTVNYNSHSK